MANRPKENNMEERKPKSPYGNDQKDNRPNRPDDRKVEGEKSPLPGSQPQRPGNDDRSVRDPRDPNRDKRF